MFQFAFPTFALQSTICLSKFRKFLSTKVSDVRCFFAIVLVSGREFTGTAAHSIFETLAKLREWVQAFGATIFRDLLGGQTLPMIG